MPLLFGDNMTSTIITFDKNIFLEIPNVLRDKFPTKYTYKTFPDHFCGSGEGISEKIIPDYIFSYTRYLKWLGLDYSIKMSPACWIHDKEWIIAAPTWDDFHASNDRLARNMSSIIEIKCRNELIKARAFYRPVTYKNAVNLHGKTNFWTLKSAQGFDIPNNARIHVDIEQKNLYKLKQNAGELTI